MIRLPRRAAPALDRWGLTDAPTAARVLAGAWWLSAGLALFTSFWLWRTGAWHEMVTGDPTGISVGIVVLSVAVTGWAGTRVHRLLAECGPQGRWRAAFRDARDAGRTDAAALLSEATHGPHETAWWFAGACIKLGLLGTVVGFIVMASQLGSMHSFDIERAQELLARMTGGMAIALYTTLVGLLANLWLGLQLLLLDRLADRLVAAIVDA
jgi:hypothetical protein